MKIACIEDDEADAFLIQKFMPAEMEITHYRYLNDFLESDIPYDLILTDLRLPDAYGPEVIRKIRQISGKPIIVLSGVGGQDMPGKIIETIKNSGATIFLSKHKQGFEQLPMVLKHFL